MLHKNRIKFQTAMRMNTVEKKNKAESWNPGVKSTYVLHTWRRILIGWYDSLYHESSAKYLLTQTSSYPLANSPGSSNLRNYDKVLLFPGLSL